MGRRITKLDWGKRIKKNDHVYSDIKEVGLPKKIRLIESHKNNAWEFHRSGWGHVLYGLKQLHTEGGLLFDDFFEQTHSVFYVDNVKDGKIPFKEEWVGFFHNPPNSPRWQNYAHTPQMVFSRPEAQESLKLCKGIFVFTEYLKKWFDENLDIPCEVLCHPTEIPDLKFDFEKFKNNPHKTIIQLGHHLRKILSIQKLQADMSKVWLMSCDWAKQLKMFECQAEDFPTISLNHGNYKEREWVSNDEYDMLLSQNIAFMDLYDSSVNNAVIECIVRNTPVLINKISPIVEYLGKEYPFYFDDLDEAAKKAEDIKLIKETHEYLTGIAKDRFVLSNFLTKLTETSIYKSL